MFSNPIFYVWLVWFLAVAACAVIRHQIRRREEQQCAERRRQRDAVHGERPVRAVRRLARPAARSANYRDELVAAGIIKPAAEPQSPPSPETESGTTTIA